LSKKGSSGRWTESNRLIRRDGESSMALVRRN